VGRAAERAALDSELKAALQGQARVVLLTGEVGIGKSRLWHEWAATLPGDLLVLETRCLDVTQALPFVPLTELFRSPASVARLFTSTSPVSPLWLAEVARLLPEIRVARPDLPAPAVLPAEEERRRVFEAFAQCVQALAAHPLVIFVDDLHWADTATLEWLGYLVHRLRDYPLLIVATYRPEDASAALVRLVAGWGRMGVARQVALQHLTREESAALLVALGGDLARAGHLQVQSAGNPYFLIELQRAPPGDVPTVLAELVRARLAQLPEPVQQVLQAAVVLAPYFDLATLRQTSGKGEEETLDGLDALLQAAVLTEEGNHYTFAHPLVATVVREGLSGARRAFLHRRAAEALEAANAGRLPPIAGQLAAHYREAGDTGQAARYAEMAAEHALALAAPDEASSFYRQALALEPTPARYMGLGYALSRQGAMLDGRDAFDAARRAYEAAGDRPGVARAALSMADSYIPVGRADEGARWAEYSLQYLDAQTDPLAHAQMHHILGTILQQTGRSLAEAERHLLEAAQLATDNNLCDMAARSRFELGNLMAERGDLAGAIAAYRETISLAQRVENQLIEVLAYNNVAYHALLAGDLATAHAYVATGLELTETRALTVPRQWLYSTSGEIALVEGQWDEAESWFTRGMAEAQQQGNDAQVVSYQANLGLVARGRGDLDGALLLLAAAREAAAKLTSPHLQAKVDLWLVELYRARGERAAAEEALARATTRLAGSGRTRLQAWAEELREAKTPTLSPPVPR
jgi:tetratricopeptide (TPR) repeat protein